MKSLKTIFGAIAIATLLGVSFSASAQENNNRDENGNIVRGAYETNRFGDNWFINLGGGVNTVYNDKEIGNFKPAVKVELGKWFTPSVGARVGWQGIKDEIKDYPNNVNGFHFFHGDLLWNLSNALSGYKETRFWDFIPFVGAGALLTTDKNDNKNWEYATSAGLINNFRLGGHVDLNLEIGALLGRESAYTGKLRYIGFPYATLGLGFNLGKSNWDRHSTITPVVVPVPFTVDQYNALKNRVAELEKENAALRNRIAELEARKPETVYVDNTVPSSATIYFDLGSSKISAREQAHLEYYASTLPKDAKVTVIGSADSGTGTPKINSKLSADRAKAVKDLLVSKLGLSENNINVETALDVFDTPAKSRVVIVK